MFFNLKAIVKLVIFIGCKIVIIKINVYSKYRI